MRKSGIEVARTRIPKLDPNNNVFLKSNFNFFNFFFNKPINSCFSEHLAISLAGAPHICLAGVKKIIKGWGTIAVYFSIAIKVIKSLKRDSSCMQREH